MEENQSLHIFSGGKTAVCIKLIFGSVVWIPTPPMGPEYLFRSVENRQHIGTHAPPKVPFMRARQIHVLARAYLVIFFSSGVAPSIQSYPIFCNFDHSPARSRFLSTLTLSRQFQATLGHFFKEIFYCQHHEETLSWSLPFSSRSSHFLFLVRS